VRLKENIRESKQSRASRERMGGGEMKKEKKKKKEKK